MQNSTGLHHNKGVLVIRYWEYPYWGSGIGYGLINGHTGHERRHRKHISLADVISAKHILVIFLCAVCRPNGSTYASEFAAFHLS